MVEFAPVAPNNAFNSDAPQAARALTRTLDPTMMHRNRTTAWGFEPHAGGVKIPETTRRRIAARIEAFAAKRYRGKYTQLEFRFRGALCYVDAYVEPENPSPQLLKVTGETREQFLDRMRNAPMHLCRLRHFAEDRWSVAFFTYSNERYEPCVFLNGSFVGTPEEAFELCAGYLG